MEIKSRKIFIKKYFRKWIFPLLLITLITIAKSFPSFIEAYYSSIVYPIIGEFLRTISGWLPFTIGDIFYAIIIFRVVFWMFIFIKKIVKKQLNQQLLVKYLSSIITTLFWVFILFNMLWGFNYSRLGIAHQLKIEKSNYTKMQVEDLVCDLVDKVNATRKEIVTDSLPNPNVTEIFNETALLYDGLSKQYSFLTYKAPTIKTSLYSGISHYIGFTGYYNPFSGEAQLSNDIPRILAPYVSCHEVAHQLGYASEDEANFVGYLACSNSKNAYFRYSVYLDLYKYASMELFMMDFDANHGWELDSLVKKDLRDIRKFFARKRNKVAPIMSELYGQYLKANQQIKGIESYNEVVGLLIAYKKKNGKI